MSSRRFTTGSLHLDSATVRAVLYNLARHPYLLLCRRWNWKSALMSALVRGLIFFSANFVAGWRAAVGAMAIEFVFRVLTAGFYGAITQSISRVQPGWASAVCAIVILPVVNHVPEFLIHWASSTPKLASSIAASAMFTVVSTLFNLYAMRNGVMIVGPGCCSLKEDLRRMPRIVVGFVCVGPVSLWRLVRRRASGNEVESARAESCAD